MDAHRALISVVIPCYNQGHYLAEAIQSAVSTAHRVEVIVVDDGSTDDTSGVAARYPGVTCVHQENRGLAAARNCGLQVSTGDFVVFLDADDRLMPGGLDAGAAALASRPECAMAYGRCVMIGPDGAVWPTPEQPLVRTGHYAALLRTNLIWMPAMAIFRRAPLVEAGGFAAGFDAAADYDLYLRMARTRPVHDHGRVVAAYRRHPQSMSGSARRMLRETIAVMRRNRRDAADASQDATWREGYAAWKAFYGTQLVEEIRAHVRRRELYSSLVKAGALARYAPRVFGRELWRKARTPYAGRAVPAAEISAARRRAES